MINKYSDLNDRKANLVDISKIKSYRDIFSSFQWTQAFQKVYNPKNIQRISCEHMSAYYCLGKNKNMIAVGDPFNDFNMICRCSEFISSIENLNQENSVFITNTLVFLTDLNISETNCFKVILENCNQKISNRISKQYDDTKEEVAYQQISVNDSAFGANLLWLLKNRQKYLMENRIGESNDSYYNEFNNFIIELCSLSNHCDTIRLEILKTTNSDRVLAMSLNFYASDGLMCYLRACDRGMSMVVSYGLILDMYTMLNAKRNKYQIYDLTRGDEPYKLRLGADKYVTYSHFINRK